MGARRPRSAFPQSHNEGGPNVQWLVLNIKGGLTKSPLASHAVPIQANQLNFKRTVQSHSQKIERTQSPVLPRAQAQAQALAQA